ncbi:MAG: hypothetical protein DRJ09_01700 [Bacteroidetes bacterium]|nr:MAG: hypothetical protein DRJ09_01700 [Bacteroidota bacterium]
MEECVSIIEGAKIHYFYFLQIFFEVYLFYFTIGINWLFNYFSAKIIIMKKYANNNWRLLLVSGFIAIFYGILALFATQGLILTIVTYLGALILIASLVMLYGVYTSYKNHQFIAFDFIQGLVMFIFGILLTFFSQNSLQIFVIIIGVWAILMGVIQLYMAFKIPKEYNGKTSFIINGLVTLIFGIALMFNPFEMASYMVVLTGVLALLVGVVLLFLAFKLKSFRVTVEIDD